MRLYGSEARRLIRAYRAGLGEARRVWLTPAPAANGSPRGFRYGAWLLRILTGLLVAAGVVALVWVAGRYEGSLVWPALATEFVATVLGVLLALSLGGELERRRIRENVRREAVAEQGQRLSAARLAFSAMSEELGTLETSLLRVAAEHRAEKYLVLDLPTGSWEATRSGLGATITDFELIASLSRFYGGVADLQYLLRLKAQATLLGRGAELDAIADRVDQAVGQARQDLGELTERIVEQIRAPAIGDQPTHRISALGGLPVESVDSREQRPG